MRAMSGLTAHQKWALTGWAVSLVVSSVWIRSVGCPVWPDVASSVASHLLALSALWLDPRLLPPLGCALMGVCVGLMLVDMAFDLVIIREGSVRLGPTTVTPGRCAWPWVHSGRHRSRVQRSEHDSAPRRPRPCVARACRRRVRVPVPARACARVHRAWTA